MSLDASQVTMGKYHPVQAVTPGKWTSVHRTGNCWARHTMLIEYIKFKTVFLHNNKRRPLKEWWLWLGYLGMMPGASVSNSAHGRGHEEGGFGICKGGIEPQEIPCSRASTPKTRVPTLLFYALTYTSDFTGGWPPATSLGEGVNLQLQVNKNSWAWQECFNLQTPLKIL